MRLSACVTLLLLPVLPAQFLTSPAGMLNQEGSTSFPVFGPQARFMQIDNTQRGQNYTVRSLAWRREGNLAQSTQSARTMQMTIRLGRGDFAMLSEWYDYNYVAGTRTQVYQGSVSFPDWRSALPGPTPFDLRVTLSQPFAFSGASALLVDVEFSAPTFDRPWVDMEGPSGAGAGSTSTAGSGCTPTGASGEFTLVLRASNLGSAALHQYPLRLDYRAYNGPYAATSVMALIDGAVQNLPGLCAPLRALPTISFPLPASGGGVRRNVGFPFTSAALGLNLVTQLVAPDPGQAGIPVALSSASRFVWTTFQDPLLPECATVTSESLQNSGALVIGRGLVTRLGL